MYKANVGSCQEAGSFWCCLFNLDIRVSHPIHCKQWNKYNTAADTV